MRVALSVLALLTTLTPALAGALPARPGQSYLEARQAMLQAGYSGERTKQIAGPCPIGRDDDCRRYVELFDCSGSGLSGCQFVFWKGRQPVLVETQGEDVARQRVVRVKVMTGADQTRMQFPVIGR